MNAKGRVNEGGCTQGCSVLMIWAVAVIGVQRQPPWPVGGLGFA